MKDILNEIVEYKRIEVDRMKALRPQRLLYADVERILDGEVPSLKTALMQSDTGIIAEFKRRSPSKGWIKEEGLACDIPLEYQRNGASAVSILTDGKFFGGDDSFITEARGSGVTLPVLYKNFVVDEYQLFQARLCGASAVLLIASVLGRKECGSLLSVAHELGMEVLLELHDEHELDYVDLMPDVCGVNNRNLGTFVTDVENSFRLASMLPSDMCKVSESGISSPDTILSLRQVGFNGFLIGECFMKAENPGRELGRFVHELEKLSYKSSERGLNIKVCGLTDPGNVLDVMSLGVDMLGFIFYKDSPRYVSPERMDTICRAFDQAISSDVKPLKIGVFVDSAVDEIVTAVARFRLDGVQLHGHEDVGMLDSLRSAVSSVSGRDITIIKALCITSRADVKAGMDYCDSADMLLFDTRGKAVGGNGIHFDWSVLEEYDGKLPFILSGGIGHDDAKDLLRFSHPRLAGIDLNSRFETSPGIKNIWMLSRFINEMRVLRNKQQ